jgi:hypothetical protein
VLKGAIHTHSTYSDGEFTLEELREIFVAKGCAFVCVADHAESFDSEKLNVYLRHCEVLSDNSFLFVPGLEYAAREGMHVLGYGMTTLLATKDLQEIVSHIESEGGISVIAHPKEGMFGSIETLKYLPKGLEVWNSKYDGRYAPRPGTIALFHRLRQRRPDMQAFYGQDLHWKRQYRGLLNLVQCETLGRDSVLRALASGRYCGSKDGLVLPASGEFPHELLQRFAVAHRRSARLQRLLKGGKRLLDRLGISVPAAVKAQMRRLT